MENGQEFYIDKDDYERVSKFYWSLHKDALTTHIDRKEVSLTRYILQITDPSRKILQKEKGNDYRKKNLYSGNIYTFKQDYIECTCYDNRTFLISTQDFDTVSKHVWHIDKNGYVTSKIDGEVVKLHRFLFRLTKYDKEEVDHISRNCLDNRRENLRLVNRSQNCINRKTPSSNTSGVKGVYKPVGYDKWIAQINYEGKRVYLGSYDTIEDATEARLAAESKFHKEYICK